jgi:hypothetical protein
LTTSQLDEVQIISCRCGPTCSGTFKLRVEGQKTAAIAYDATAATLKDTLAALTSVRAVSVTLHNDAGSSPLCSDAGSSTSIVFTHDHGDLQDIQIESSTLADSTTPVLTLQTGGTVGSYVGASVAEYTSSQDGTREDAICNNRGV